MLQRVQAEVGQGLGLRVRIDCDDAAFLTKFVENNHSALSPSAFLPSLARHSQSAATAANPLRNARSSAPSYSSCNSAILADTATLPSTLISIVPEEVSPIVCAETP